MTLNIYNPVKRNRPWISTSLLRLFHFLNIFPIFGNIVALSLEKMSGAEDYNGGAKKAAKRMTMCEGIFSVSFWMNFLREHGKFLKGVRDESWAFWLLQFKITIWLFSSWANFKFYLQIQVDYHLIILFEISWYYFKTPSRLISQVTLKIFVENIIFWLGFDAETRE